MQTLHFLRSCGLALSFCLLTGGIASAQDFREPDGSSQDGPPTYAYGAPEGSQQGVQHTGTDVIQLAGSSKKLQVMVWDRLTANGKKGVTLSWSQFNTGNSTPIPMTSGALDVSPSTNLNISDPDVVMAYYQGVLYANVVYLNDIDGADRVYRSIYTWTGSAFIAAPGAAVAFGSANMLGSVLGFPPAIRRHSAPNIDANAAGVVAIAWQESSVEKARITVQSASYPPPGYSYDVESITFAEGYFLTSRIDGGGGCTVRGFLVSRKFNGTSPSQNPPVVGHQTLLPDVAVSPNGKIWLTYINSSAIQSDPPIKAGLSLVMRQIYFDACQFGTNDLEASYPVYSIKPPRIAATANPNRGDDAEVVIAQDSRSGCAVANSGYYIDNYGYANGDFHEPALVNNTSTYKEAVEPVVAFYGGEGDDFDNPDTFTNNYIVSWTGTDYEPGNEMDIWARSLNAGQVVAPGDYSRVNMEFEGVQRYPSVAGRYVGDRESSAHLFANLATNNLGYKLTPTPAGQPSSVPPRAGAGTSGQAQPKAVQAFPNPFSQTVDFNLNLRDGERVQHLQITDLSGRVLETLTSPAAGEKTLKWNPKQVLPDGSYMVRLVTNQRTETINLGKR